MQHNTDWRQDWQESPTETTHTTYTLSPPSIWHPPGSPQHSIFPGRATSAPINPTGPVTPPVVSITKALSEDYPLIDMTPSPPSAVTRDEHEMEKQEESSDPIDLRSPDPSPPRPRRLQILYSPLSVLTPQRPRLDANTMRTANSTAPLKFNPSATPFKPSWEERRDGQGRVYWCNTVTGDGTYWEQMKDGGWEGRYCYCDHLSEKQYDIPGGPFRPCIEDEKGTADWSTPMKGTGYREPRDRDPNPQSWDEWRS